MADKQTVTDGSPKGGSEVQAQGSDLTALLQQYETETGDQGEAKVLQALQPVVDFAKTEMGRREQERTDDAVEDAYKFVVADDALKGMSKSVVRGFMEAYGIENPEFGDKFRDQKKSPDAWNAVLGQGRDWIKEQMKELPKSNLRSDIEAAKAVVAGTSTDEPEEKPFDPSALFEMSDSEFDKTVKADISRARK